MSPLRSWYTVPLASLCVLLCMSAAHADGRSDPRADPTKPEARAHYDRATRLFGLQKFEEAAEEYKQGALIESVPVFDFALGQCYRLQHKNAEAIWHYNRFIKYGRPTGKLLKGVNDLIASAKAEMEKSELDKPSNPEGPIAPPAASPAIVPSSVYSPSASGKPWYQDRIGVAVLGTGLLSLGAATYFLLDANRLRDESNTDLPQTRRNELHDQAGSRYQVSATLGIGGGVLVVAAVAWLALGSTGTTRGTTAMWNMGVSKDGVVVFGRF
jgi:hypothetical protein